MLSGTVFLHLEGKLCPNEKTVYLGRFFLVQGCTDIDKSLQSHSVVSIHLNHFHCNPVVVNFGDFCKPDVDKRAFTVQPESDSHKIPWD